MTTKSHFLGIRVNEELFDWMEKYAKDTEVSISQVVRQGLIELMGKTEALRDATDKESVEVLKQHIGDMFRFRETEEGFSLERVKPQTIMLGSGERRKKDARESKTA